MRLDSDGLTDLLTVDPITNRDGAAPDHFDEVDAAFSALGTPLEPNVAA
jgi:hypothetical protein